LACILPDQKVSVATQFLATSFCDLSDSYICCLSVSLVDLLVVAVVQS